MAGKENSGRGSRSRRSSGKDWGRKAGKLAKEAVGNARTPKKIGSNAGRKAGRIASGTIESIHMTAHDVSDFTSSFIESFRREIRKSRK
jgi:hypothetical protein